MSRVMRSLVRVSLQMHAPCRCTANPFSCPLLLSLPRPCALQRSFDSRSSLKHRSGSTALGGGARMGERGRERGRERASKSEIEGAHHTTVRHIEVSRDGRWIIFQVPRRLLSNARRLEIFSLLSVCLSFVSRTFEPFREELYSFQKRTLD